MRIAFLSTFFVGEYGVTRVIAAQMPMLVSAGHQVDLYACFLDKSLVAKGVHAVSVPTHFICSAYFRRRFRFRSLRRMYVVRISFVSSIPIFSL